MPRIIKKNINERATRAINWGRVSSETQADGYSLEAQQELVEKYCLSKGLEIIKTFNTVESSTRGERKKFKEMIKFVKEQKKCIAIVCDKVDRLQRSFSDLPMIDELRKSGRIELHFRADGQILTANSTSSELMTYNMFVLMANNVTNRISEDVKRSNKTMISQGKWGYVAPFGYSNSRDENNKPDVTPDTGISWIIAEMFNKYATGLYTLSQIGKLAEKMGFKGRSGKSLSTESVSRILSNRFYIGEMYSNGEYNPHYYETFVDKAIFEKCQEVRKRKANPKMKKHKHIFQGLIFCKSCGRMISTDTKNDGKIKYLFCPKCKGVHINEQIALKEVKNVLRALKQLPRDRIENAMTKLDEVIHKEQKTTLDAKLAVSKSIANYETMLNRFLDLFLQGSITQDNYNKKIEDIKREQSLKENQLKGFVNRLQESKICLKVLIALTEQADELFESSNFDEKRLFLKIVFSNFLLEGKNCCFSIRKPVERLLFTGRHHVWQGRQDLNPRHSVLETDALPAELHPCNLLNYLILNYHQQIKNFLQFLPQPS